MVFNNYPETQFAEAVLFQAMTTPCTAQLVRQDAPCAVALSALVLLARMAENDVATCDHDPPSPEADSIFKGTNKTQIVTEGGPHPRRVRTI